MFGTFIETFTHTRGKGEIFEGPDNVLYTKQTGKVVSCSNKMMFLSWLEASIPSHHSGNKLTSLPYLHEALGHLTALIHSSEQPCPG